MDLLPTLAYVLLVLGMLLGTVGSLVPALPGCALIAGGALLHGLLTGWTPLGAGVQAALIALLLASQAAGFAASALGARRYGASRWGVAGSLLGLLLGLPLLPPFGPFLGAFVGATVAELIVRRRTRDAAGAARAGWGATLGAVLGLLAELGFALLMDAVILVRLGVAWLR